MKKVKDPTAIYTFIREIKLSFMRHKVSHQELNMPVDGPGRAAVIFKSIVGDQPQENFAILLMDNKNKVTGFCVTSVGTVSETIVHPREVFVAAIQGNASSIIIMHNHPSGVLTPSREDIAVTKRLTECGTVLGIPILDHVIVNTENATYLSMKEEGYL